MLEKLFVHLIRTGAICPACERAAKWHANAEAWINCGESREDARKQA